VEPPPTRATTGHPSTARTRKSRPAEPLRPAHQPHERSRLSRGSSVTYMFKAVPPLHRTADKAVDVTRWAAPSRAAPIPNGPVRADFAKADDPATAAGTARQHRQPRSRVLASVKAVSPASHLAAPAPRSPSAHRHVPQHYRHRTARRTAGCDRPGCRKDEPQLRD